jgi:hypothetical protein
VISPKEGPFSEEAMRKAVQLVQDRISVCKATKIKGLK